MKKFRILLLCLFFASGIVCPGVCAPPTNSMDNNDNEINKSVENRIPEKKEIEVLVGYISDKKIKKAVDENKLQLTRTEYYQTLTDGTEDIQ
jgi:hypothetical protein